MFMDGCEKVDWSKPSVELAIAVTGPESARFPCVGLRKNTIYERKVDTRN
jgi:hypothetical protein